MDNFYKMARMPVAIIDIKGNVLVGAGWQDICVKFHRIHPEACRHCVESDTRLSAGVPPGEFRLYKCQNGMWDVATPIMVGGQHVGNVFSGQFFFEGEPIDYEFFRRQARRYGFDGDQYLAALDRVPRINRESLEAAMTYFMRLADMLSRLSYSNVKLARSLAERDALMQSLTRAVEELRRSNQELEQFAYVASHDLQEPLRQVRAFVQLLREHFRDGLDAKPAQYMHFIVDGAARMSELVHDLLAYSRVGARERRREPASSREALDAALANLRASIAEARAQVSHDELPTVAADRTQLVQLFQNLLGNAVKFRRDGEPPRIHVAAHRDGRQWVFSVRDNGIGVALEHHDRIFLIFQRLHNREKYSGTGIGLSICKKIVEQHGGKIWLESAPGEGSTFYFSLPEEPA